MGELWLSEREGHVFKRGKIHLDLPPRLVNCIWTAIRESLNPGTIGVQTDPSRPKKTVFYHAKDSLPRILRL
jgi:hypothetical protein